MKRSRFTDGQNIRILKEQDGKRVGYPTYLSSV